MAAGSGEDFQLMTSQPGPRSANNQGRRRAEQWRTVIEPRAIIFCARHGGLGRPRGLTRPASPPCIPRRTTGRLWYSPGCIRETCSGNGLSAAMPADDWAIPRDGLVEAKCSHFSRKTGSGRNLFISYEAAYPTGATWILLQRHDWGRWQNDQ